MRKPRENNKNPKAGRLFERKVQKYFRLSRRVELSPQFPILLGCPGKAKKPHNFDLVSEKKRLIVECKNYAWTAGKNSPSAKYGFLNELMFYFTLAPKKYRKILFMRKHQREGVSLAGHYVKNHRHLIPKGVEIWQLAGNKGERVY